MDQAEFIDRLVVKAKHLRKKAEEMAAQADAIMRTVEILSDEEGEPAPIKRDLRKITAKQAVMTILGDAEGPLATSEIQRRAASRGKDIPMSSLRSLLYKRTELAHSVEKVGRGIWRLKKDQERKSETAG